MAALALLSQACAYNYGVPSDDPSIQFPCRYAHCEGDAYQFESPLFRQRHDSTLGYRTVELELRHLQRPVGQDELGLVSSIELETFDSLVSIDVASVLIEHRRLDGSLIAPVRITVDTISQCPTCDFYLRRIRVRYFYGNEMPKRLTERVSVDLIVRGSRRSITAAFDDLQYRRHYTLWDVLMGV